MKHSENTPLLLGGYIHRQRKNSNHREYALTQAMFEGLVARGGCIISLLMLFLGLASTKFGDGIIRRLVYCWLCQFKRARAVQKQVRRYEYVLCCYDVSCCAVVLLLLLLLLSSTG